MTEKPLYKDDHIRIDYHNVSPQDHVLFILTKDREEITYLLQRGILRELATTPRGGIERKIENFNPELLFHINEVKIGVDGLHVAICQAYAEEEDRFTKYHLNKMADTVKQI